MPNVHEQITSEDFKAPEGARLRIMHESMEDGELKIVADFYFGFHQLATDMLQSLREQHPDDVWTLCDHNGPLDE